MAPCLPTCGCGCDAIFQGFCSAVIAGVHLRCGGGRWRDSGLVFTTTIGTPLDPRNVDRQFKAILKAAGLPAIRFHDLRHTAATLLLAQGVDPRTIMETLGHSQISLTLNTYAHVVPALQRDAAAKMDAILGDS